MPYATEADLDTKWGADFITLLALDEASELRDSNSIGVALENASALMDGYLAKRYTLPLDAAPAGLRLLRNLCCDLTASELANTPGKRNDIVEKAADRALKFLADVAASRADIPQNPPPGGAGGALPASISPNEAIVAANDRMFSRNRLRSM